MHSSTGSLAAKRHAQKGWKEPARRIGATCLAIVLSFAFMPLPAFSGVALAAGDTYDKTAEPVVISSPADLVSFSTDVNAGTSFEGKTVQLAHDIDLSSDASASNWTTHCIGTADNPFKGTFDGRHHAITGLSVSYEGSNSDPSANKGLFGYIEGATVQSLTVSGSVSVTGTFNEGTSKNNYVGGVIAHAAGTCTVTEVGNNATVEGTSRVGGVIGGVDVAATTVSKCYNKGAVTARGAYSGGIVGYCGVTSGVGCSIASCYNTAAVANTAATTAAATRVGGIAGAFGYVTNSFNTGAISATGVTIAAANTQYGAIAGNQGSAATAGSADNPNYWAADSCVRGNGTANRAWNISKTADEMAAEGFVALLNTAASDTWAAGPVLAWETAEEPPAATHTVTFETVEGAQLAAGMEESIQVEDGATVAQPSDAVWSKTNNTIAFDGWYAGDERYDFSKPVTSDLVLTGKFWQKRTLTFNLKLVADKTSIFNKTLASYTLTDTTTGETFSGTPSYTQAAGQLKWTGTNIEHAYTLDLGLPGGYELQTPGIISVEAGSFNSGSTMKTTTVNMVPTSYAISYDLDGGELPVGSSNPESYTIETDDFTLVNPVKDGKVFAGWTGTDLSEPTETVTVAKGTVGARSYTATWGEAPLPTYTVTFGTDSPDSVVDPQQVIEGGKATKPSDPEKTHFTFAGWFIDDDLSGTYTEGEVAYNFNNPVTAPVALVAKWDKVVTFTINVTSPLSGVTVAVHDDTDDVDLPVRQITSQGMYNVNEKDGVNATHAFTVSISATGYASKTVKFENLVENSGSTYAASYTTSLAKETYQINYENLQGATAPSPATYSYNVATITLRNPSNIPNGLTFEGWWSKDGSADEDWGEQVTSIAKGDTGDKIFYAKWSGEAVVDKDALTAAVTTATAARDAAAAAVAENADEVFEGETFYFQADVDALTAVIADAQTVLDNEDATQAQVDEAAATLSAAVDALKGAAQEGTRIPADTSVLDAAIATAAEVLAAAQQAVAEDAADVPSGEQFYAQEDVDAFAEAIAAAKAVAADEKATQEEVDEAVVMLAGATEALENAAQDGSKKADFAQAQIASIDDQVYTSYEIKPAVAVTVDDEELELDKDYMVAYTDNIEVGIATVTVTGAGTWDGQISTTFNITSLAKAKKAAGMSDLKDSGWYMNTDGGAFPGTETLYLDYAFARGIMSGNDDGTFKPDQKLTRAQAAMLFFRIANPGVENGADANSSGLKDVKSGQWYTRAVNWCVANNVVTGFDNKTFKPNDPVTREQLATMICRFCVNYSGMASAGNDVSQFKDASSISSWAREGVAFCAENGIVSGSNGKFNPRSSATRCEAAKMISVTDMMLDAQ